jgi:hypothetical protein
MNDILRGFQERMETLALFHPLFTLERIRKYDYDTVSLGLAVLLFILDKMLASPIGCNVKEIPPFIQQVILDNYGERLSDQDAEKITNDLLDSLRNSGLKHSFSYQDLEAKENKSFVFNLVENVDYQLKNHELNLKLTLTGLDLVFKTREFNKELRISVNQLKLKQQIERGVFEDALGTVKEIQVDVYNLHEEIKKMRQRIRKNPVGQPYDNYVALGQRITNQLEMDQQRFIELLGLIDETEANYDFKKGAKEKLALNQLLNLRKVLNRVKAEHLRLFSENLGLDQLLTEELIDGINRAFDPKIHIEKEVLDQVIRGNMSMSSLARIVSPLLPVSPPKALAVNRFFAPQNLRRPVTDKTENLSDYEEDLLLAEIERKKKIRIDDKIKSFIRYLLEPLFSTEEYLLSDLFKEISNNKGVDACADVVTDYLFYKVIHFFHNNEGAPLFSDEDVPVFDGDGGNELFLLRCTLDDFKKEGKDIELIRYISVLPPTPWSKDYKLYLEDNKWWNNFKIRRISSGQE